MIGETVSHYRILKKLGEGGMGVVYLAEDTHLGRRVAIKFLASTNNHNYRARFLREARAVSHLSHPSIAIIHDYGETKDGQPFIVMEYVKGAPLNELLSQSAITLTRALSITEAVAEALGDAHMHGIIHRDIKPSNVLVSDDGKVKVLDFGLVKQLHEEHAGTAGPDAPTLPAMQTSSNVVVGTPLYLSPEQATGGKVDARSDLFALGSLLYESVTGKPPFAGKSVIDIGAQIIHFNPPPPSSLNEHIPAELDRIILKALAKKPEDRYQSATDFLQDLRGVRELLTEEGETHRTQRIHQTRDTQSSALKSISDTLRRPRVSIGFFLVGMALVGLGLWFLFKFVNPDTEMPFQKMKVTRLTTTGKASDATISPNGQYVVYVIRESGRESLWLRHVATGTNTQIIQPSDDEFAGLTFSPDSNYIYFVQRKTEIGSLFKIPVLGGSPQKILNDIDSHASVSPDGARLAFVRLQKAKAQYDLFVVNSDGSGERRLATRANGDFFSLHAATAWAPDSRSLACATGSFSGGYHMNLVEVRANDGTEKPLASQNWFQILHLVWPTHGQGLILAASGQAIVPFQIWYVSYPKGSVRRITNDLIDYDSLAVTADSHSLITLQVDRLTSIWLSKSDDTQQPRQISSGVGHTNGVSWAGSDKLLYSSAAGSELNIWRMSPDGNEKTQLTANSGVNYHAVSSPDDRYIVFTSNRNGSFNIWRMNADGGNLRQLTTGGTDLHPAVTPDNKWVIYESYRNGVPMIWKVSIDGGVPEQLTSVYSSFPAISPDGKTVACRYFDSKAKAQTVALISIETSQLLRTLAIPIHQWQRLRWLPDGSTLSYINVRDGVANVWIQNINGGPPRQVTKFKSDLMFSYDWSRDGQQLACERGLETSDVVLISDVE